MRKIQPEVSGGAPPIPKSRLFEVTSIYNIEIIPALSVKLGCSQATMYRTLLRAKIPIYHVPNRPGNVLLLAASLWRLATTPVFKKYIRSLGLSAKTLKLKTPDVTDKYSITLSQAVKSGLLPLTVEQALLAAECGLIPHKDQVLESWFVLYLEGYLPCLLPSKPSLTCH